MGGEEGCPIYRDPNLGPGDLFPRWNGGEVKVEAERGGVEGPDRIGGPRVSPREVEV